MCGILCLLSLTNKIPQISEELLKILENRGPNKRSDFKELNDLLCFFGFVLWQQGDVAFSQPAISEQYVLLLNGDIFNAEKSSSISDTEWLLNKLNNCDNDISIVKFLSSLQGPYSLIFYNRKLKNLYFVRDLLGRNSLILERDTLNECIKIASTSNLYHKNNICIELPPIGVYKLNLEYNTDKETLKFNHIDLYLWKDITIEQTDNIEKIFKVPLIKKEDFSEILRNRTATIRDANYFNFYNLVENEKFNVNNFLTNQNIALCVEEILNFLRHSLKDRIVNTPKFCANCIQNHEECNHAKIGILFSGGLDCSILARLSHEFCNKNEPIDLINVAFENVRCKNETIDWNTPDRLTAIKSYEELKILIPERKWNLIEVNVNRKELQSLLLTRIKHLIYPLNTVLDESLGACFWFASRAIGLLEGKVYESTCRVILIGSGADEMFGGYTRHRNAFTRTQGDLSCKIEAIDKELKMDWDRIAFRNLGRDDRVIADNHKTARSPYIEEQLVNYVTNLKPEQKCCFLLNQGIGDKLLLRLCGFKLGLNYSSKLQKRAIQFGSKIADKKQNATDISLYLSLDN